MSLHLYNTLTRQKEIFRPLQASQVSMYTCGVTVYGHCHLGHARTYITWDLVRRYLLWRGYDVRYVQNFTDIDDKIVRRAQQEGTTMAAVAERYIAAYFEDMERLQVLPADAYPRVTQSLAAIVRLIKELEARQHAYRTPGQGGGEDVYFAVRSFAPYGQLSGRRLDDLQAGASGRVEGEAAIKRDPFDFALWKSVAPEDEGFDSPWGRGRPGWHIECSAMVRETLGDHIDIHTGGADLIFPHHENELAQSEPVVGRPLAKYWLHNGFLNINGTKMSKSLGNFTTIRTLLETYEPLALRLFFLQTHYRSPIDLSDDGLQGAANGWQTLKQAIAIASESLSLDPSHTYQEQFAMCLQNPTGTVAVLAPVVAAMDDDFNSPGAVAVLFEQAKTLIKAHNQRTHGAATALNDADLRELAQTVWTIATVLGLACPPEASPQAELDAPAIEALLEARQAARQAKDFAKADAIRQTLQTAGITVIDQAGGPSRWVRH